MDKAYVSQGYRENTIAGLGTREVFIRGLHGIVVHIKRASMLSSGKPEHQALEYQHLGNADHLLTFMIGMADSETDLGRTLTRCYTGIQYLISVALQDREDSRADAIQNALEQAVALENTINTTLSGIEHGQPA